MLSFNKLHCIGGDVCETKDGAFSNPSLKNRNGDGYNPQKVRRKQNKKIRKYLKKHLIKDIQYDDFR